MQVVASKEGLDAEWEIVQIEENVSYLAYSRTADSLPLSLTHVGVEAPCRDAEKRRDVTQPWYALELGREREVCDAADADTRYTRAAILSTNLYELEESSGVSTALEGLPGGEAWVESSKAEKEAIVYGLWSRPTIPWTLTVDCEDRRPRTTVMSILKGSVAEVYYSGRTIMLFGIVLICGTVVIALGILPSLNDGKNKAFFVVAVSFLMAFQISLTLSTMFFLSTTLERFDNRVDASNRLAAVNGCSDEATRVPFVDLQADFDSTEARLRRLISITVFMIVASLFVGVTTIPTYYCVHYVSEMGDGKGVYIGTADQGVDRASLPVATEGRVAARKIEDKGS